MTTSYLLIMAGIAAVGIICVIIFILRKGASGNYPVSSRDYYKKHGKKVANALPVNVNLSDLLVKLKPEYHVVTDYEKNGCTVDCMVLGPTGIFVIGGKDVRGKIDITDDHLLLEGKHLVDEFVETVKIKAKIVDSDFKTFNRMKKLVKPVLCFTNAVLGDESKKIFGEVLITSKDDIVKSIEGYPRLLEPMDVESIFLYLEKNVQPASSSKPKQKAPTK